MFGHVKNIRWVFGQKEHRALAWRYLRVYLAAMSLVVLFIPVWVPLALVWKGFLIIEEMAGWIALVCEKWIVPPSIKKLSEHLWECRQDAAEVYRIEPQEGMED